MDGHCAPVRVSQRNRRKKPATKIPPPLFGRPARTRLLICLSQNGPLYVRQLGRLIGSDSRKTFDMVQHFESCGVVKKIRQPGFRRYVVLDEHCTFHRELSALLSRLSDKYPMPILDCSVDLSSISPRSPRTPKQIPINSLFGSEVRTLILLALGRYRRLSIRDLSAATGCVYESVAYAAEQFERANVLYSRRTGRDRIYELSPHLVCVSELGALLKALLASHFAS